MQVKQILGGRYELVDQIGVGGMAIVWRAHDEVLGRSVAVKLLAGPHAGDPSARRRIRDEARAAAMLSHPHIAQVYDFGESTEGGECIPYVVMELVSGGTLAQRLAAAPMSADESFRLCSQVAAALAAAHADGLVHRDIKPANVMVTPAGAKVVDFGIAAAIRPGSATADPAELLNELFGTPAYLAPERLTGDAVEPASDVYALGVMLYRMLAGHSPWSADTTTKMLAAHIYIDPMPLPRLPRVPDYVTGLVNRCLSKDPTQRPTAREAAALLAHAAGVRVADHPSAPSADGGPADGPLPRVPPATPLMPVSAQPVSAQPVSAQPVSAQPVSAQPATPAVAPVAPTSKRHRTVAGVGALTLGAAFALLWVFLQPGYKNDGVAGGVPQPGLSAAAEATGRGPATGSAPSGAPVSAPARLPGAQGGVAAPAPADRRGRPAVTGGPRVGGQIPGRDAAGGDDDAGQNGGGQNGNGQNGNGQNGNGQNGGGQDDGGQDDGGQDDGGGQDGTGQDGGGSGDDGGGEAVPPPTAVTGTSPAPPELQTRTLSSDAGTLQARCESISTATILSSSPSRPWKVRNTDPGPSSAPTVDFRHGNDTIRMTVTCSNGEPSTRNTEL